MLKWLLMLVGVVGYSYSFGVVGFSWSIIVGLVLVDVDVLGLLNGLIYKVGCKVEVEDYVYDEGKIDYDSLVKDMWESYKCDVGRVDDNDDYYNYGKVDWSEFNKINKIRYGKYYKKS